MIVSTTITSERSGIIADAIRSVVDHVDRCILVDIGADQATIAEARAVAGDKLRVVRHTLTTMGDARNAALVAATEEGAGWAITVDTDERLRLPDSFRRDLRAVTSDVLLARHVSGAYTKERAFRLPCTPRWRGNAHECWEFEPGERVGLMTKTTFDELPKTPEQLQSVAHNVIAELRERYEAEETRDARLWYYLGDAYALVGDDDKACDAWARCALLDDWPEQRAWAMYRCAVSCAADKYSFAALERCGESLAICPTIAEAAILAAELDPPHAATWLAIARAIVATAPVRLGFCDVERLARLST